MLKLDLSLIHFHACSSDLLKPYQVIRLSGRQPAGVQQSLCACYQYEIRYCTGSNSTWLLEEL